VIRVFDAGGNVIEAHEHAGEFQRVVSFAKQPAAGSVRNLRHSQSEALTELRNAFEIEVELILGAQR
jgi:hypothetical protein